MEKLIYFISELAPVNTHASSAVFYRHFKKLEEEGFRITWVTDENSFRKVENIFPSNWQSIRLPNRRWHLPPYKANGPLQTYRFRYYLNIFLKIAPASITSAVIISYINGQFLAPFAAYLSRKLGMPMIGFFHDDILELNYFRNQLTLKENTINVLNACNTVFVVSDQFKLNWQSFADKFQLLYPIPDDCDNSERKHSKISDFLTFCYSGAIYDEMIPFLLLTAEMLNRLNHKFIIVGDRSKTWRIQKKFPDSVLCFELFETPSTGNAFIAENADCAIIPYPDEIRKMPWIATCFPSKFVQYNRLGIPTIIMAPIDSAVGKWCRENNWPLYLSQYDFNSLHELIETVNSEVVRKHIHYLNLGDFNPSEIHQRVRSKILELIDPKP